MCTRCIDPYLLLVNRAAAITAFLDREIESKGLDWLDQHKLKKDAQEHAEAQLKEEYDN